MSVKGFKLSNGNVVKYDYSSLDNIVTDNTLSVTGTAADAGAVGTQFVGVRNDLSDLDNRVEALEEGGGSGLTESIKSALLQIAQKIAYIDEHGQNYYDDLYDALYPPASLSRISCVYTQSGTVYNTDTLNSLKSDLVVTAHFDNSTSQVVTNYTLSGTLNTGTSTVTVSYSGKTTTFTVNVTERVIETISITWSGGGTDKTASPVIDARNRGGYLTVPFVSGASELSSNAADGENAMSCVPYLYSDSSKSTFVGYYDISSGEIYTSSSWTWSTRPSIKFGEDTLVAPTGYYAEVHLSNNRSAFTSNSACLTYLNTNANKVTLP